MTAYECVALSTLVDGDFCLRVSWWAPAGSDWRPAWAQQRPDELYVYVAGATVAA